MKLYLDDERETPPGWERVYNVPDCIAKLKAGGVEVVSLDHDLGTGLAPGYEALVWIEKQVFTDPSYVPPKIMIHTANPSAREKMRLARFNIFREIERRAETKQAEGN